MCAFVCVRALVVCMRSFLRVTVGKCEKNGFDENVLVIDFSHAALFLVFYENRIRDEGGMPRTDVMLSFSSDVDASCKLISFAKTVSCCLHLCV